MPPSARIPTVEFRSLLLPPVRIPLRALQSLHRPQRLPNRSSGGLPPQCLAQRRHLCLYKTAKAETVLGQHKLLPFDLYKLAPPDASEHVVNVVINPGEDGETTVKGIKLQDVYDNYVKAGHILCLLEEIPKKMAENVVKLKEEKMYTQARTYGILKAESMPSNIKGPQSGKGEGALRVTPVSLSSPLAYFKVALDRSYQFIKHGSPVEFSIRSKGSFVKKEDKLAPGDLGVWPWLHDHFPHLRPDFILKSMPEGSMYAVEPVSDGRIMQFVIVRPSRQNPHPKNITGRLFKVKNAVKTSIKKGQQAQLPKRYRSQLMEGGLTAYSPMTGLPLKPEKVASKAFDEKWKFQEDAFEGESLPASHRYMPVREDPEERLLGRTDKLTKEGNLKKPNKSKPRKRSYKAKDFVKGVHRGHERGNVKAAAMARGSRQNDSFPRLESFAGSSSSSG